jgi:DNA-binding PadR family transcriptional regulator
VFADNTLTPKEAIRLCALGTLAQADAPMLYSALANAIRHFTSRITGPSLDIMGTSIELLKYEGLVAPIEGDGAEDDSPLALTDNGRAELKTLMTSRIRAQGGEVNKLIATLKLRFLHLLEKEEQIRQIDLMIEGTDTEIARLDDLRNTHENAPGYLSDWLDHDISQLENHLNWLEALREKLCAA